MSNSVTNLFDIAALAAWTYDPKGTGVPNTLPSDVGAWRVLQLNGQPAVLDKTSDGFYAEAFKNSQTGEIVISIRGTVPAPLSNTNLLQDAELATLSNFAPILNAVSKDAAQFAIEVAKVSPSATITLTGHSLGGYAAQVATIYLQADPGVSSTVKTNLTTVTFNAPAVPAWLLTLAGSLTGNSYNAYNFFMQGDIIHDAGGFVHLGQSTTVAVGPNAQQLYQTYLDNNPAVAQLALVDPQGAFAEFLPALAKSWLTSAHTITNFVGTNQYFNDQIGFFSANPSLGAMTAAQYFSEFGKGSPLPLTQLSVSPEGGVVLGDGTGNTVTLTPTAVGGMLETLTAANTSVMGGVSNLAGFQAELNAAGPANVTNTLLDLGTPNALTGSNLTTRFAESSSWMLF